MFKEISTVDSKDAKTIRTYGKECRCDKCNNLIYSTVNSNLAHFDKLISKPDIYTRVNFWSIESYLTKEIDEVKAYAPKYDLMYHELCCRDCAKEMISGLIDKYHYPPSGMVPHCKLNKISTVGYILPIEELKSISEVEEEKSNI